MNALSRTAMNVVLPRARFAMPTRTMAVESRAHLHKHDIPTNMKDLKNNIWLSDPGAYPVIAVLTFACGMSACFISYCVLRNPDVRFMPGRRQQVVRDWEH
mmetsp:Transcript_25051/g.45120  ORF Transcript_25051/g.45120 Transcript_25051/m.45120 type:complete len:101 (-) Transcript_25051:152-454(-)|eukprot:CAMPEP_0201902970 /NCGR_PEP_ID=MMETSP0902-20130614/55231_1 /ASSEMBLY_ACC=CAM_ASM_000551 /TAXON_ID=420261 /ORGANISM="Thalassiosira antarctica, Strain CCMP982" /LENGTH=100 /DNA_ID=CAMNT_0048436995 /DNA_START=531 /DNA_END=833 /DNA_ORIENTATION=-